MPKTKPKTSSKKILEAIVARKKVSREDLKFVLKLAKKKPHVADAVQDIECDSCHKSIFTVDENNRLSFSRGKTPFVCDVCNKYVCGLCRDPRVCYYCSKLECWDCIPDIDSMKECVVCMRSRYSYCQDCQGVRDEDGCLVAECDLCQFSICQYHGDSCDICDIQTCGFHDFHCDTCDFCSVSLCPNSHGHGDGMWWCLVCKKKSCNANGDAPSKTCPIFEFETDMSDWPVCQACLEKEKKEIDDDESEGDY